MISTAGSYCPTTGMSVPTPCALGMYCVAGSTANNVPCSAGCVHLFLAILFDIVTQSSLCSFYCPTAASQTACASGTYCVTGSTINNILCIAGCVSAIFCLRFNVQTEIMYLRLHHSSYCPSPDAQTACALGTYCAAGSTANSIQCTAGYYCVNAASQKPCPTGTCAFSNISSCASAWLLSNSIFLSISAPI